MESNVTKFRGWDTDGSVWYVPFYELSQFSSEELRSWRWDQFTGLTDQDNREIYAGDIYEIMGYTYPITVDYTHGLRFMWGDEQLNNAICTYGIYRGNIHENPELTK